MIRVLNNFGTRGRSLLIIVCCFCLISVAHSQEKHTETLNQVWLAYFNQTRFSEKFGVWLDLHLRTKEDFFTNFSQSVIRPGLTYYLTNDVKLTFGYAYVSHYPEDNHSKVTQPEHRIWQQVQWYTNYKRIRTRQWVRLEEKFRRKILNDSTLVSGYNFYYKVRYNLSLQVPLAKKAFDPHSFAFVVNDEVHINFGKQIKYNYFDQNRFFIGFGYQTTASDQLQFGYMNVFQQLSSGNQYKSINAARIFYFHNLDLRKKKAT